MTNTELFLYATAAIYPLLMLIERLRPLRWQPKLPAWRLVGSASFRQVEPLTSGHMVDP